jgi:hypothetical protein
VTAADRGAAALVGAAGLLQLLLLPQHWAESRLVGLVFAALVLGQLGVATALGTVAGPRLRRAGRWAALGLVALYLGARVLAPAETTSAQEVDAGGLAGLVLELGALAALTVGLPLGGEQSAPGRFPRLLAAGVGLTFLVTDLAAGGELLFSAEAFAPAWGLTIYATPPFGRLVPALQVSVAGHWSLYLPWASAALAVLVALGLALAVGWTVQLARLRPACPHRFGVLAAGSTLAQPLLLLAAVLVTTDAVWVRWQLRRAQTSQAALCH